MSDFQTIPDFLERSAEKTPDTNALVFEDERVTYAELNQRCNRVRNYLASKYEKGDRIAVMLDNSITFLEMYFGILKADCVAVLFSPNISDPNLQFQIEDSGSACLLTTEKFKARIDRNKLGPTTTVHYVDQTPIYSDEEHKRIVKPDDLSTIIYTSGTTSNPKGVELRHRNTVAASKNIIEFLKITQAETYLNILPLSHSFGLGHVHVTFMNGGTVIIERNAINLPRILKRIQDSKATFFAAVPATLRTLVEQYPNEFKSCTSLTRIVTNTDPMPPDVTKSVLQILPQTNFYTYYGLTEASRSSFIIFNENQNRLTSAGQATPNVKIEIRDDDQTLTPGEKGEICISGDHVVEHYWNNAEATKKIKNKWLYTGDLGYLDSDGFLYIVGRLDEVINIQGEKVSPYEIESVVKKISGVSDVAAVKTIDDNQNTAIKLFVVLHKGEKVSEDAIIQACKNDLEPYKIPRFITFIEALPKTDTGKIQRTQLEAL